MSCFVVLLTLAAVCPHPGSIFADPLTRHTKICDASCYSRSTLDSVASPEPHPLHERMRLSLEGASLLQGLKEAPGVLVWRHIVLQARCSTYTARCIFLLQLSLTWTERLLCRCITICMLISCRMFTSKW